MIISCGNAELINYEAIHALEFSEGRDETTEKLEEDHASDAASSDLSEDEEENKVYEKVTWLKDGYPLISEFEAQLANAPAEQRETIRKGREMAKALEEQ